MMLLIRKINLIKNVEGDNNGIEFNTLDQNILKISLFVCLRFELNVFK